MTELDAIEHDYNLRRKLWTAAYLAGIRQTHLAAWFRITRQTVQEQIAAELTPEGREAIWRERLRWPKRRAGAGINPEAGRAALQTLTEREVRGLPHVALATRIKQRAWSITARQAAAERREAEADTPMGESPGENVPVLPSVALPSAADLTSKLTAEQRTALAAKEAERTAQLAKWHEEQAQKEVPPEKPRRRKRAHYDKLTQTAVEWYRTHPEDADAQRWFTDHPEDKP